jgi:phosphate:Na+ symporter
MLIFLSGLFLFLLGLEGSKIGLTRAASDQIRLFLLKLNTNILAGIITGIIITAVLQSSSAVTVILISLIEAKILNLRTAISIVLGANIGTTLTLQIISLPVLELYPYLIITGIFIIMIELIYRKKIVGYGLTLCSFGIVFAGLEIMTNCFQNPSAIGLISRILAFSSDNCYSGMLLGFIITGIIQSSSAVTGITISLARNNLIDLPTAIAIALGSNIGTCITGFLASLNCGRTSRALASGHFLFNLIGVIVILPFLDFFIQIVIMTGDNLLRQIANAHTLFNLFNVLIFLPFFNAFISLIQKEEY